MRKMIIIFTLIISFTLSGIVIKAEESGIESAGSITSGQDGITLTADDFSYLNGEIAAAANGSGNSMNRRMNLKSKGNLNFNHGAVYLSSNDFIYLADQIDLLEKTFKVNLVNELNSINTFFRADGSLVYDYIMR